MTVRGAGLNNPNNLAMFQWQGGFANGDQFPQCVHREMQQDISNLANNNGDMVYNTNASHGDIGLNLASGSHWKNVYTGTIFNIMDNSALIIQSEVRILEKKRRELLNETERLENIKKEAEFRYNREIEILTKQRDNLIENVNRLQEGFDLLTRAYLKAKQALETLIN